MNKIICDVCGTDYPETASQCPICGCASAGAQTAAGNDTADVEERAAHAPVKGGRYSKANVRKRLKANQIPYDPIPDSDPEPEYEDDDVPEEAEDAEEGGSNRGLIVVVIILLLAIVAVASYIAVSFFDFGKDKPPVSTNQPSISETAPTTEPPTETTPVATDVACTKLELAEVIDLAFEAAGEEYQLAVTVEPENTTDKVLFASSDENVVTVDETGKVVAVGDGKANITITCGDQVIDCPVICGEVEEDPDATTPEDPEATEPEDPDAEDPVGDCAIRINGKKPNYGTEVAAEATIKIDEELTIKIVDENGKTVDVEWTASKEDVVTIDGTSVTGANKGKVVLTVEIGDQKLTCTLFVQ